MKLCHLHLLAFASSALALTVLHPNGVNSACLDVQGGILANGIPVQICDCNGTPAQRWSLTLGTTAVRLANTEFCLDSTFETPPNGMPMRIWRCTDGTTTQQWEYTATTAGGRLSLANREFCLDLREGDLTCGNIVQSWQCPVGVTNEHQIWTS